MDDAVDGSQRCADKRAAHGRAQQAGNAGSSYLIHKLEGTQTEGSRMLLGGPFLDQATIDRMRAWINAGAPNN